MPNILFWCSIWSIFESKILSALTRWEPALYRPSQGLTPGPAQIINFPMLSKVIIYLFILNWTTISKLESFHQFTNKQKGKLAFHHFEWLKYPQTWVKCLWSQDQRIQQSYPLFSPKLPMPTSWIFPMRRQKKKKKKNGNSFPLNCKNLPVFSLIIIFCNKTTTNSRPNTQCKATVASVQGNSEWFST